jgi:hypothetical protein
MKTYTGDTATAVPTVNTALLLSDRDVARSLSLSLAWVRKQRWLRNRGESHVLTIDPVRLGKAPRYRAADLIAWMESLKSGGIQQ